MRAERKELRFARAMPPLLHSFPGEAFDPWQSEVLNWLAQRHESLTMVFNHLREHGAIVYDTKTGRWRGVDYAD